MKAVCWS